MARYDRSLTFIIFYSMTGLLHLSYSGKIKIKNKKGLDIRNRTAWYDRSLTPIISYGMTSLTFIIFLQNKNEKQKKD